MDTEKIQEYREQQLEEAKQAKLLETIKQTGTTTANTISRTLIAVDGASKTRTVKVDVQNNLATTSDIKALTRATMALGSMLKPKEIEPLINGLKDLSDAMAKLPSKMPKMPEIELPEQKEDVRVTNLSELDKGFQSVVTAVGAIPKQLDVKPTIEVKPTDVVINEKEVDLAPLLKAITSLEKTVKSQPIPQTDMKPVVEAVKKVTTSINSLSFPVPNYVLPYKNEDGNATQVTLTTDGKIPVESGSTTYETIFDDTTEAGNIYLGKALPGTAYATASWQIKKFNGTTKATTFADDEITFNKAWADRTTYNY